VLTYSPTLKLSMGAREANNKPNKQTCRFGETAQRQEIHPPLG
jgi:hypothetical protein